MAKKEQRAARPAHKAPAPAPEQKESGKKEFDNSNRGVLFQNDKDGNEKRPDFTGTGCVTIPEGFSAGDSLPLRLAAWEKTSKAGNPFLSLTIQEQKPKEE